MADEQKNITEQDIRQLSIEEKTAELKENFTFDGYRVVRKELFAHLRDPAVTIRKDSVTFNTACIEGFEDVIYINVMVNLEEKKMVIRRCDENTKDALRWCVAKLDKRKSRKVVSKPFSAFLYSSLGWDTANRYKMLGYKINFEGEDLYIFDLSEPEIFAEGRGRRKAKKDDVPQGDGYSPDNWQTSLGMPVEEHKTALNISMIDGYVSMEAVNGSKLGSTPEEQTT